MRFLQVNEELNKSRAKSGGSQLLSRVEKERDNARLEVKQLRCECNSLYERVRLLREGKEREEIREDEELDQLRIQIDEVSQ